MYTPGEYQQPKRPQLQSNPVLNPNGCGSGAAGSNDYGKDGYTPLPNNRSTVRQDSGFGVVGGFMKAAVAPLLDVLRPSRKENVIGNINPTGNVQSHVAAARVWNPADRAPTTNGVAGVSGFSTRLASCMILSKRINIDTCK